MAQFDIGNFLKENAEGIGNLAGGFLDNYLTKKGDSGGEDSFEGQSLPGYTRHNVDGYNVLMPEDRRATTIVSVTPEEQYAVDEAVGNRLRDSINENWKRTQFLDQPSESARRKQSAELRYGASLPSGSQFDAVRDNALANADFYGKMREDIGFVPPIQMSPATKGSGPSIPYPGQGGGGSWDEDANLNRLNEFYKTNLGREVGDEGKNYWLGNLARGIEDWDSVESNIRLNPEYTKREDTKALYNDMFDRDATEEELATYVGPGGVWKSGVTDIESLRELLGNLQVG